MNLSEVINSKNLLKPQSAEYFLNKFPIKCVISQERFSYYFFSFFRWKKKNKKTKMKPRVVSQSQGS